VAAAVRAARREELPLRTSALTITVPREDGWCFGFEAARLVTRVATLDTEAVCVAQICERS
jgi:hypothetical protein